MANWSTMKRSIMIGSLSGPNFVAKRTGKIAAHELISLLLWNNELMKTVLY